MMDLMRIHGAHLDGKDANILQADNHLTSVLHVAAACGSAEQVEWLLALQGMTEEYMNGANSVGDTPLHAACRSGRLGACMELLCAGADVSRKNMYGRTPIYEAAYETLPPERDKKRPLICQALMAAGAEPIYLIRDLKPLVRRPRWSRSKDVPKEESKQEPEMAAQ